MRWERVVAWRPRSMIVRVMMLRERWLGQCMSVKLEKRDGLPASTKASRSES